MTGNYLTKLIASTLIVASVLGFNPIGVSAAWKQNSTGWWYTEGNSYATGWRNIDRNWYYFKSNGYMNTGWINDSGNWFYTYKDGIMAHDCYIGDYYLNSNGAWTNSITENEEIERPNLQITKTKAIQILLAAKKYLNKPSDKDISLVSINNREYYRILVNFTYPLQNADGTIKYRTTSEATCYIDTNTGELYTDMGNGLVKYSG
jgi:hypothetical protein